MTLGGGKELAKVSREFFSKLLYPIFAFRLAFKGCKNIVFKKNLKSHVTPGWL